MLLAQAMSLNDMEGVVRLQKHVLVGTFSLESLGSPRPVFRFFTLLWPLECPEVGGCFTRFRLSVTRALTF